MLDLRGEKVIDLSSAQCLKEDAAYLYKDEISGKYLVVKLIAYYEDNDNKYLLNEFKKMFLLSAEPEIGTVYYLATARLKGVDKSCYVMDYVSGDTIGDIIKTDAVLSYEVIVDIIMQLASGLEKSHNYEIAHSDLHEENIKVDKLGFLKIIDYAFWRRHADFEKDAKFDVSCFNEIVNQLCEKCQSYDQARIKTVKRLCDEVDTFKNLRKCLELVNEVSFDYNLLSQPALEIVSALIKEIPFDLNLSLYLSDSNIDIPVDPQFEQTPEEKRYMDAEQDPNARLKLKYSDQRLERIDNHIKHSFLIKLSSLKLAGLIDWNVWVSNAGQKFLGPYKYNYQIGFTPKILKWKRINEIVKFLPDSAVGITQLLILDSVIG